jgi:hypothetical protein
MRLLHLPIPTSSTSDFPMVQYTDDTLIIVEGDTVGIFNTHADKSANARIPL